MYSGLNVSIPRNEHLVSLWLSLVTSHISLEVLILALGSAQLGPRTDNLPWYRQDGTVSHVHREEQRQAKYCLRVELQR